MFQVKIVCRIIFIYVYKLTTIDKEDRKAPSSIATTSRYREGKFLISLDCFT